MIYNLKIQIDRQNAQSYFDKLMKDNQRIELKKKIRRSLKQNSYLHLLLGAYGLHFGYSLAESKMLYKKLSPDIYFYEKNNQKFIRSSADLNSKEMTITIERFRDHSNEGGKYLAAPGEEEALRHYEQEIENNRRWL